jgi:hypothetical protein
MNPDVPVSIIKSVSSKIARFCIIDFSDFIQSSIGRAVYVKVVLWVQVLYKLSVEKVKASGVVFLRCPIISEGSSKIFFSNPMFVCLANQWP